ncbi:MAG: HAD family phosphatase [Clostridia bacterium]|nr:HAD family phosphatase [Clostridia bacterium]
MKSDFRKLIEVSTGGDGFFHTGENGVKGIYVPKDKKTEFIDCGDRSFCYVKSELGLPAIYPYEETQFEPKAEVLLMDLDGTTVTSEEFWIYIIQQTVVNLLGDSKFTLENADIPFVSGHSTADHLMYCINKYAQGKDLNEAMEIYHRITKFEMNEIMEGRGNVDAFTPAPHLKEFLTEVKRNGIKIGLVTSGLDYKAMPENVSAFRKLDMGDPAKFYDGIINAGYQKAGRVGTLGEVCAKPHPWLYFELAKIGLGASRPEKVVGIEDSSAGVLSLKLAGYNVIGLTTGNIDQSGVAPLCSSRATDLMDSLPYILKGESRD